MKAKKRSRSTANGPKRRQKHYSYDESVNEAAKLIDDEPADVEEETPAEANEPLERVEDDTTPETPAF